MITLTSWIVRTLLITAAFLGGVLVLAGKLRQAPIVVAPPPPIAVASVTAVLPSIVVVPSPPPATAAVEPPEAVEPPQAPRPRAPWLNPACLLSEDKTNPPCAWDDGFPAISGDGRLIADRLAMSDPDAGDAGLTIELLDVATSRRVDRIVILDPRESMRLLSLDSPEQETARRRLQDRIDRRVKIAQRRLDRAEFRSLAFLGGVDEGTSERGPGPIHAEAAGTTARLIDPATSSVLGHVDFAVPNPNRTTEEFDECSGWRPFALRIWWDATTRVVFGETFYSTGGCICGDAIRRGVAKRLPGR